MKYFFTASIPGAPGEASHSAEAVRYRIKQMIDQEEPKRILSDDAIVKALREQGVDIARRTVAKYRESLRIPSSIERATAEERELKSARKLWWTRLSRGRPRHRPDAAAGA